MQTNAAPDRTTPLPPPPAPPARDANPWPWPEQAHSAAARPESTYRAGGRDAGSRPRSAALQLALASGIAVFVVTAALYKTLDGGSPKDLVGVMLAVLLLGVFVLARLRRARRRANRTPRIRPDRSRTG
jgi:hypothetical protein